MPSYINGIDASLITGLGQIGVGGGSPPTPPTIYPSGGLVVNSGFLRPNLTIRNGRSPETGSNYFYNRPGLMDSASLGTSEWIKIVSNGETTFFLSSSGELYAIGTNIVYSGTGKTNTLSKVTTGSNWTDIAAGSLFAIGICDNKLFGIGSNISGQFGNGTTTSALSNTFIVINNNPWWTKVSCGNAFTMAISGSGGSGSIFSAGSNAAGRTGQNITTGNTTTFTQPVGFTGSIFTDVSCGEDFALAISGGNIYGTGEAGDYTLGNGSTTDRTTFGLVSGSGIFTKVFAFTDFSKAIDINEWHYHTGNEPNTRGDGSTAQITTWTRLNTTGEFASGWQNFYSYHLGVISYGVIGVKDYRPFYIGSLAQFTAYQPNTTWTDYVNTNTTTWTAFVSGSPNVSCSAAAFSPGWNNILDPLLFINLTPVE